MEKEKDGIAAILSPDRDPLLNPTQLDKAGLSNRCRLSIRRVRENDDSNGEKNEATENPIQMRHVKS